MLVSALGSPHLQVEQSRVKVFAQTFPTKLLAVTWHFVAATTLDLRRVQFGSVPRRLRHQGSPRRTRRSGCRGE